MAAITNDRRYINLGDYVYCLRSGVRGVVYSVFLGEGNLYMATIYTRPTREDSLSGGYTTLPVDGLSHTT
jgi:hypothetical protein